MNTQVKKWGSNLAIIIPPQFANELNIDSGTEVDIEILDSELVIKVKKKDADTLENLIAKVTPENQHDPIRLDKPAGKELI